MTRHLAATWLIGKKVRLRALEAADVPLLRRFGLPVNPKGTVFIVQTLAGRDVGTIGFAASGPQAAIGISMPEKRYFSAGHAADALCVLRAGMFKSQPLVRIEALVPNDVAATLRAY